MRKEPLAQPGEIVSFGPFTLRVNERLLARNGVPLDLGGRAMDVLLALIARANAVVSKEELLAEAWPGVVISDGSLRYQITMLRQALGDGQDGARYVSNIVGRGYCFVAKISRTLPNRRCRRSETSPRSSLACLRRRACWSGAAGIWPPLRRSLPRDASSRWWGPGASARRRSRSGPGTICWPILPARSSSWTWRHSPILPWSRLPSPRCCGSRCVPPIRFPA